MIARKTGGLRRLSTVSARGKPKGCGLCESKPFCHTRKRPYSTSFTVLTMLGHRSWWDGGGGLAHFGQKRQQRIATRSIPYERRAWKCTFSGSAALFAARRQATVSQQQPHMPHTSDKPRTASCPWEGSCSSPSTSNKSHRKTPSTPAEHPPEQAANTGETQVTADNPE
jgi:hypothetical protein